MTSLCVLQLASSVLLLVIQSYSPAGGQADAQTLGPNDEIQMCGGGLIDMLSLLCGSVFAESPNFNAMARTQVKKRADYLDSRHLLAPEHVWTYVTSEPASAARWRPALSFHALRNRREIFGRQIRNPGGLASECCLKACKIETLMSYCGRRTEMAEA